MQFYLYRVYGVFPVCECQLFGHVSSEAFIEFFPQGISRNNAVNHHFRGKPVKVNVFLIFITLFLNKSLSSGASSLIFFA